MIEYLFHFFLCMYLQRKVKWRNGQTGGYGKGYNFRWLTVLLHTSVCTLYHVMAQPQSFLHCFYDLPCHTWIVLPLKLQRLEARNLLNSVPGYFLLQRGLVFTEVFYIKSDSHPALHYYIQLTCAEVHFHQN